MFQSSPAPKGECYTGAATGLVSAIMFQSSPAPKGECYASPMRFHLRPLVVSILTRPEGRVLRLRECERRLGHLVSILTRPEGRVLRGACRRAAAHTHVSILTRPEGRVLQGRRPAVYAGTLLGDHKPRLNAGGTREELRNCNRHVRISEHLHCAYRQVCQERRGAFPPPCANRSAIIDCYRFAHDQTTRGSRISNRGFRPIIKVCL